MKLLILITLLFSPFALASDTFNVKTGLWNINTTIESDGKVINPQAEVQKVLAQIPEAQRAQMMEMMKGAQKQTGAGFLNMDLSKICITKDMLDQGKMMENKDCDFKVTTKTASKLVGNFTCKDGTKGDVDWTVISSTQYKGVMNGTDKNGKKAKVNYQAKFIKDKCS